jgi:hypothetical protein
MRLPIPYRLALYALGGALGLWLYLALVAASARYMSDPTRFGWLLVGVSALSVAGTWAVLASRSAGTRRARIAELAVICAVGILWRAVGWAHLPTLSNDAYRYVWDGHLILHGVSPYLHPPDDPALAHLRDGVIWPHVGWPTAPTIYPPGAEALFTLVNLLTPLSFGAWKAVLALCDLATGGLMIFALRQRGLDPRRAILYWWSPLPLLEFALNAHLDAVAILLTLAAVLAACATWHGARAAAGMLLGLAALVKLYPLLFVVVLARRADRAFWLALGGITLLGYAWLAPLGLGGGGFLGTYFHQRFVDQGLLERYLALALLRFHATDTIISVAEFLVLGLAVLGVLAWRLGLAPMGNEAIAWRVRPAREIAEHDEIAGWGRAIAGVLALTAAVLALAPHVLPWYAAAFLPFLALSPFLSQTGYRGDALCSPWGFAPALAVWLFTLLLPFSYVVFAPGGNPALFQAFFLVPLVVALAPLALRRLRRHARPQPITAFEE